MSTWGDIALWISSTWIETMKLSSIIIGDLKMLFLNMNIDGRFVCCWCIVHVPSNIPMNVFRLMGMMKRSGQTIWMKILSGDEEILIILFNLPFYCNLSHEFPVWAIAYNGISSAYQPKNVRIRYLFDVFMISLRYCWFVIINSSTWNGLIRHKVYKMLWQVWWTNLYSVWVESTNNSSIPLVGKYTVTRENQVLCAIFLLANNFFFISFRFSFSFWLAFYSTGFFRSFSRTIHASRFRLVFITINVFIISQYAVREQSHKII